MPPRSRGLQAILVGAGKTWKMYVISIPSNQVRRERDAGKNSVITILLSNDAKLLLSNYCDICVKVFNFYKNNKN